MFTLQDLRDVIREEIAPIILRLDRVEGQLGVLTAVQFNSTLGRDDRLRVVPLSDGSDPIPEFPSTLAQLIVAGNELLHNGLANTWNSNKSLLLLRAYDPTYETDEDQNDEQSRRSRDRRLRVAQRIGVTRSQLNFAQMSV
jgi:hypothetical protein